MARLLLRRIDDALCAFATGHSRRDRDRARRKRLALRALRTARAMRAYVAASSAPAYLQDWLDEMDAEKLASASAFDDLAHRLLVGLECAPEALLLNELDIHSAARYARARRDLLDIDAAKGRMDVVPGEGEAAGIAPGEGKRKLHKRLTKQACLDFLHRQFGLGGGNGHPFSPGPRWPRHVAIEPMFAPCASDPLASAAAVQGCGIWARMQDEAAPLALQR
ncbi:hypothetical protein [Hoeflea sp. BAL378]|uniref:hypothetical protein n=1 Tax=Hoeflea sp. BAL378 TaxID=1547437 RepID=UPI00126A14EF|nr:hypothetical protein [Hoeflea sp. BAL378]